MTVLRLTCLWYEDKQNMCTLLVAELFSFNLYKIGKLEVCNIPLQYLALTLRLNSIITYASIQRYFKGTIA